MQFGTHNKIRRQAGQLLVVLAFFLASPKIAYGASLGQAMSLPGFKNLMLTIAMLNKAMNDAAANPMDQWRRQNVAHMMGMMPAAIIGLAKEFQQGKLKDNDLPMVQAVLGGFIDKNVGDKYTAFVKNPSKGLIPQVGQNFPSDMLKSGGVNQPANSGTLVFDDNASKGGSGLASDSAATTAISPKAVNEEITNLGIAASEMKSNAPVAKESATLTFDDQASKNTDAGASVESAGLRPAQPSVPAALSNSSSNRGADFSSELLRDLSSVESSLGYEKVDSESALEGDLEKPAKKREVKKRRRSSEYQRKIDPKFFSALALVELATTMYPFAHAEEGSKAAEVLFGLAAIMASISPMVAASIQAGADKDIAQTNANAQITMTKMSTDTSKFLADQQRDIALQQAGLSAQISKENQDSATRRLELQLAELRTARQETNAIDEKKRAYQQQLDQERIQLAKDQAAETVRLANVQLRAQLTQAGMAQGFTRSQGIAGSGISVAANGSRVATSATATTPTGAFGSVASAGGTALGVSATKRAAANKLVASARSEAEEDSEWVIDPKTGKRVPRRNLAQKAAAPVRGIRVVSASSGSPLANKVGSALRGVLNANTMVQGSTPSTKPKTVVADTAPKSSFAEYLNRGPQGSTLRGVAQAVAPETSGHSGAYNPPDLTQLDRGLMRSPRGDRSSN